MYNVTFYKNTGFNTWNIPDNPNVLNLFETVSVPAIDTLQQRVLPYIRVRTSWDNIKNCDYVRIDDFFYTIGNVIMTSSDVATILLIPDFLLSAGGAASLTYSDGITERVHIALDDDTYGAYTEDDILTQPIKPLKMVQNIIYPWSNNQSDKRNKHMTLIESTVDIHVYNEDPALAVTYTSDDGETVTVPYMQSIPYATSHLYGGKQGTCTYRLDGLGSDGTTESPQIQDGLKRARGLGVESAIIAQYNVPMSFVSENEPVTVFDTEKRAYKSLGGMINEYRSGIPWMQSGDYNNMRVTYGSYTPYGILTCAGNRAEYNAESIYEDDTESPTVSCHPDIRSDGMPYYRFLHFYGDGGSFWQNCLAGARWANVPLVYNERSGNVLDRQIFDANRNLASTTLKWARIRNAAQTAESAIQDFNFESAREGVQVLDGLASSAGGLGLGADYIMSVGGKAVGQTVIAGARSGYDVLRGAIKDYALHDIYKKGEIAAITSYLAYNEVVAPEIVIPYNTNIMRELYDNGAIVYRYIYDDEDLHRIDILLTMYGYKVTKRIEQSDFTNRAKFNFVKASSVSVTSANGNRLPKWWCDGIAAQLSGGVRVWHTIPDVTAYTDGSNT